MATLMITILATTGVQSLDIFVDVCAFIHVGAVVHAWLREGWKVVSTRKTNSKLPLVCSCKLVFLSGVDPSVRVHNACPVRCI